ncbi:hypothetical protein Bca52824_032760 [Brassica carinata]|uniref:RNase H type-1 domain-containing protein n=1 Tax=Brassica carinata TaxID=52824 RepID=A0A8X7V6H6_BRACI|nr:hypothetical protein Bca52824_032760 [Brassica carinata]
MLLDAETQESLTTQVHNALEEARLWNELNSTQQSPAPLQSVYQLTKKWEPPLPGYVKCNIHSNWINAKLHSGVVYFVREHNVLYHSRDAITFSPNRVTDELRCLVWALRSMKALDYQEIVVGSDFQEIIDAVKNPKEWPRYRDLLQQIGTLCGLFQSIAFETESPSSNQIAREISKSVLRDGRLQSYLALGGPAWLHQRILRESV